MLAGAMEVEVDGSGELFFQYLRQYAGLQDVVVAGLYNRLEIWDEATWKAYAAKTEAEGNQIAERLTNLEFSMVTPFTVPFSSRIMLVLDVRPGGRYLDATLGGATHTEELLKRSGPDGIVYS